MPKTYRVVIRNRRGDFICSVDINLTEGEANAVTGRTRLLFERLREERVLSFNTPVDIMPEAES